ncbi:terminase small subunit (plasmid) [Furfurilactobacillus rossiae]|uniref:terminase small subunit n=1 Tax=Furfurilactobacillus rossiae TaxID=231049 RepID=UPI001F224FDC|nr:terminase small subunit [Furfurilactobacillus rossiae]MCF6164783.1 terminase small subunit [Furfurilactobacillus rossiae]
MARKLTLMQQKFADEYIVSGNAADAARKAGYSVKTARSVGQENLTKPDIKKYIDERLKELESAKVATQKEVLEFLTRILRREETEQVVVTLKKPTVLPMTNAKGEQYSKFAYEDVDDVVDVPTKNSDAMKAADILTRVFGLSKGITPELDAARAKQATANARIAEHKADELEGVGRTNPLLVALNKQAKNLLPKDGDTDADTAE